MSRSNEKKQRGSLDYYGLHSEKYVPLYYAMLDSLAYRVLSPTERCIMIEFYRKFLRASAFGTEPLPSGFTFAYSECNVPCTRRTFTTSRRRIIEVGFFKYSEKQPCCAAKGTRFMPSGDWAKFKPNKDDAEIVAHRDVAKAKGVARDKAKREAHRTDRTKSKQKHSDLNPEPSGMISVGTSTETKNEIISSFENSSTIKLSKGETALYEALRKDEGQERAEEWLQKRLQANGHTRHLAAVST